MNLTREDRVAEVMFGVRANSTVRYRDLERAWGKKETDETLTATVRADRITMSDGIVRLAPPQSGSETLQRRVETLVLAELHRDGGDIDPQMLADTLRLAADDDVVNAAMMHLMHNDVIVVDAFGVGLPVHLKHATAAWADVPTLEMIRAEMTPPPTPAPAPRPRLVAPTPAVSIPPTPTSPPTPAVPSPSELTPAQRRSLYHLAIKRDGSHIIGSPDARQRALIETGCTTTEGTYLHYHHANDDHDPLLEQVRETTSTILFHLTRVGATDLTELKLSPSFIAGATARLDGVLIHQHKGRWSLIDRRRPSTDADRARQTANRREMMASKPVKSEHVHDAPVQSVHESVSVGVSREEALKWMDATYNVLCTLTDTVRAGAHAPVRGAPSIEDVLRRCIVGIAATGTPMTKTEISKRRITPAHRALVPAALDYGLHIGALRTDGARHRGYGVRYTVADPTTIGMTWDDVHGTTTMRVG